MGDLISRSALKHYLKDYRWEFVHREDFPKAIEMVDCAPTVDAVEVVRCKDCKRIKEGRFDIFEWVYCDHWKTEIQKDCFCSYGERRDDDGR